MKLTPEYIYEIRRNATPYSMEELMNDFIGLKVYWKLRYESVSVSKNLLHITLFSLEQSFIPPIVCDILETDYPNIKIHLRNSSVYLSGEIGGVFNFNIEIKNARIQVVTNDQGYIYFSAGSREELISYLTTKVQGAKSVRVFDSYPDEELLRILENTVINCDIRLLGKNLSDDFIKKVLAFNIYFNKNMSCGESNDSHARFYIIDGEVIQVDSSLKNNGGNKATSVNIVVGEEASRILNDFELWWKKAVIKV